MQPVKAYRLDYGAGLSGYAYAFRKLKELNDELKVPAAIQIFIDSSRYPHKAPKAFQDALNSLGLQNLGIDQHSVTTTIEPISHGDNDISVKTPIPVSEKGNIKIIMLSTKIGW